MNKSGFTLIELLVVIAIIGILASVVLASLNTAREGGADSAVQSTLNNMRAQAALYYDQNGNTYSNMCGSQTVGSAVSTAAANSPGEAICVDSDPQEWLLAADLSGDADGDGTTDYYCVDSSGVSEVAEGDVVAAASGGTVNEGMTQCP